MFRLLDTWSENFLLIHSPEHCYHVLHWRWCPQKGWVCLPHWQACLADTLEVMCETGVALDGPACESHSSPHHPQHSPRAFCRCSPHWAEFIHRCHCGGSSVQFYTASSTVPDVCWRSKLQMKIYPFITSKWLSEVVLPASNHGAYSQVFMNLHHITSLQLWHQRISFIPACRE